jgi:nicotinamide-nucleotide amidase
MRAEVIAIGDELTSGQRLDTNSRWLSTELGLLGIPVVFHTTAADTLEAGIEAFRIASGRADVVVATGGLGPTADDLTRDVLAAVGNTTLELSADALVAVEARFAKRGVAMPESNRRQAMFPHGSRIIPNPDGTAPGIDMDVVAAGGHRSRVFALPGVPSEMKTMWEATVQPALLRLCPDAATIVHRRIKCFGAGESAIEALLPDLIRRGREPLVGITAHEATITLRITARAADTAACAALIAPTETVIRQCLGDLVYGVEDDEVEDAVIRLLHDRGLSLATCEIGTTGRVAELLAEAQRREAATRPTDAGSPRGFVGGLVLGDRAAPATAADLAARARAEFGAAVGLGVTAPRTNAEGRMLLDFAVVTAGGAESVEHVCGGGAALARSRAAKAAIDLVRRGGTARLGREAASR